MDIGSLRKNLKTVGHNVISCDINNYFNTGYKSIILEIAVCMDNQRVFTDPKIFLYSILPITKSQKLLHFSIQIV